MTEPPVAEKLRKGLGLLHIFAIASGAMISSGLFIIPGLAYAQAGPAVVWSYLLGGLLATAGALSIAELTTAMPKAGGDYYFITRGMGAGVGTVAGVLSWFSLSLKSAFAIVGMATFLALVVAIGGLLAGVLLCLVFMGINILGVREAARFQIALVAGLLVLLVMYVAVGLAQVEARLFEPFSPHGPFAVFATAGFVFVAYGGLLNIASVAEEVRNPGRTLPLGLVLSLVIVTLLYASVVFVTVGVMDPEQLGGAEPSLQPISDGARVTMGTFGFLAMSLGAVLAFVSTANAGIMAASRYLLALSRDRLLPGWLGRVNSRFRTPHVAVVVTGAVIIAALFLELNVLVQAASTVLILANVLACLSVIVLRESGIQNYRPVFRTPLYPWLQIVTIIGLGFVLAQMGLQAFIVSTVLILAGFAMYWFYGRTRAQQESALLHLVERLTARELVGRGLEDELREVIRERDEIVMDRFDQVVERAVVLDLEGDVHADELLRRAAEELAPRIGMDAPRLATMLQAREAESSTLLSPRLAVPHVVIPGEGCFEMLLARVQGGASFHGESDSVVAVFVLVGTRDERNFHLRALAAIAQVASEADFEKRWLAARTEHGLRDILLLTPRERH